MKRITWIGLVLAVSIGLAWRANAWAGGDEKGPNVKEGEKQHDANDGMSVLMLADDLAAWGRANQHAGALAMAARLMSSVQTKPMEKVDRKKHEGKADASGKKAQAITAETLLAEAKALCGSDDKMKGEVDGIYAMGAHARGNTAGVEVYCDLALAEGEDDYYFEFQGGEWADISAIGDGTSDLDLYVYDENDNLVECDTDCTDSCYVTFMPAWTGVFHVKVMNAGDVANAYTLRTN